MPTRSVSLSVGLSSAWPALGWLRERHHPCVCVLVVLVATRVNVAFEVQHLFVLDVRLMVETLSISATWFCLSVERPRGRCTCS